MTARHWLKAGSFILIFPMMVIWVFFDIWQVPFTSFPPKIPRANAAVVKSVQSGTTSTSTNETVTVNINSVDTTKAFLIFQTRSNSLDSSTAIGGRLASATTIEFIRVTNDSDTVNIQWYLVEYSSGVSVQRGSQSIDATTENITISAVSATTQAFATWSKTVLAADAGWSADDPTYCQLTSTTNLRCIQGATAASPFHTLYWQVIEFTNASDIAVQTGTVSFLTTDSSKDVTLGTAITTTQSFIMAGAKRDTSSAGADVCSRIFRAQVINTTTLRFDRGCTRLDTDTPTEPFTVGYQVIELKDGTSVQHGTEDFAAADGSEVVTITAVDTANTIAFSGFGYGGGGQASGKSTISYGTDRPGDMDFTFALTSSTQLTLTRSSTTGAADVGWFVVEFKPDFEQAGYRFFANANSADVGSALAANNTAASLSATGDPFRLRLLLHVSDTQLSASGVNFKLQFAAKSGTCDTSFSGETYADVTGATAISYKNNSTPADGDNLTDNANDPTHSSDTIVNQDYEEANNFTNTVAVVPAGQDGLWDFALYDNGASASTDYCFRVVKSDGSTINTYTVIPQITTAAASGGTLTFTISDNSIGFGTLSSSAARYATGDGTGSASETEAHTLAASTNGSGGYVVLVNGSTLASTPSSITISAIGSTNTTSSVGSEQFGLRMTASGGNGAVQAPYAAAGFALDTAAFPDTVAADADGDDVSTTYSVRYIANIADTTDAGSYSSTLTYIIVAQF